MPYLATKDGTTLYYEDWGKGETIVFLHGVGSSHLELRDFIDEFKGEYRCITYDCRGHGLTKAPGTNMNLLTTGQDLNELLTYLDLTDVTLVGHSMGGLTIFSYVNQFGCDRLKRIVSVDITPCCRNFDGWTGGLARGEWTDEDYMEDFDRIFTDIGLANWVITKKIMNPALDGMPPEAELPMMALAGKGSDTYAMAGLWFSVFRSDFRPAMSKITVPFLHVMPDTPICTTEATDFIRDHTQSTFELAHGAPGTTHMILMEAPHETAESVKAFLRK